nr:hypothetical protein [Tanacetum cinerariifolium]
MPLYSQLEGTRLSVDTSEGLAGARCSSSSLSSSSFLTSSSSSSSLDDSHHHYFLYRQDSQQDPPLGSFSSFSRSELTTYPGDRAVGEALAGYVTRLLLSLDILLPSIRFPCNVKASPNYVLALPGNTFSESSNNLSGLVPIALPTLSVFHNDPYMKVMHAYYAKESLILLLVIVPLPLMLSPMFNPQDIFLPKELFPPKKRGQARAQIAKLQKKQMGQNNNIGLARFRIANLEQIIKEIQVTRDSSYVMHVFSQGESMCFSDFPACFQTFKTLCLLNYALMIRHDYDITNETVKDLRDALERQMCGSEYAEQDKKAAILYEYETFKANEGEQLLDTYLRYLQVINALKKCGYKKDNYELNYKFLNNLQLEWKQYGTLMRQTKNLMDINIDALYNILKQNQGDVNDALGYKKKSANKKQEYVKSNDKKEDKKVDEKKRDLSKVKCYNCKKEGHFAKDCM